MPKKKKYDGPQPDFGMKKLRPLVPGGEPVRDGQPYLEGEDEFIQYWHKALDKLPFSADNPRSSPNWPADDPRSHFKLFPFGGYIDEETGKRVRPWDARHAAIGAAIGRSAQEVLWRAMWYCLDCKRGTCRAGRWNITEEQREARKEVTRARAYKRRRAKVAAERKAAGEPLRRRRRKQGKKTKANRAASKRIHNRHVFDKQEVIEKQNKTIIRLLRKIAKAVA